MSEATKFKPVMLSGLVVYALVAALIAVTWCGRADGGSRGGRGAGHSDRWTGNKCCAFDDGTFEIKRPGTEDTIAYVVSCSTFGELHVTRTGARSGYLAGLDAVGGTYAVPCDCKGFTEACKTLGGLLDPTDGDYECHRVLPQEVHPADCGNARGSTLAPGWYDLLDGDLRAVACVNSDGGEAWYSAKYELGGFAPPIRTPGGYANLRPIEPAPRAEVAGCGCPLSGACGCSKLPFWTYAAARLGPVESPQASWWDTSIRSLQSVCPG